MALTPEELAQVVAAVQASQPAPVPVEVPVSPEPAPAEYYVHLADGRVLQTGDSSSTMIDGVAVIGRYAMSVEAQEAARNE